MHFSRIPTAIALILLTLLTACDDTLISAGEERDATPITDIEATIVSASQDATRAGDTYLDDPISRYQFVPNDKMVFTRILRTTLPLTTFTYHDIGFSCNTSSTWVRDKTTGYAGDNTVVHPERIYWSDAQSAHTFVGYSLPKDNDAFDWKKNSYYYNSEGNQVIWDTYYGALGDPLNAEETIVYDETSTETETIMQTVNGKEQEMTFHYSPVMRNEDLLLSYDNALIADNSVAKLLFYHALSSIRVIVNISGFYGTATDAYSLVSDMELHHQPTLYRWMQLNHSVSPLLSESENSTLKELWGDSHPAYNQRKTMKLWNKTPRGSGSGASKTFTFYGITVPQEADYFTNFNDDDHKYLQLTFKVTYPDPLKVDKDDPMKYTRTNTYTATLANPVYFHPGECTTINISLNHKDEEMTIGASYMTWQFVNTPDEGELKKKATFLSSTDRKNVTIVGDEKATIDDATWLYKSGTDAEGKDIILDIYGHTGTMTDPYTICTANQLLSFAYEVKNGRTFDHQFIKLDADITMQDSNILPTTDDGTIIRDKLVTWIGIGDDTHEGEEDQFHHIKHPHGFNGFFLGSNRHINNLYGSPFFAVVGDNAVIDKLNFNEVVEVDGSGVVSDYNLGLLCGINIEGDVKAGANYNYCGSIVGSNYSFIIGCSHVGSVKGEDMDPTGHVGGIVGYNNGTIIASYHAGKVTAPSGVDVHAAIGYVCGDKVDENKSQAFACYFNSEFGYSHTRELEAGRTAFPLTTNQMQTEDFVNKMDGDLIVDPNIPEGEDDFFKRHVSLNRALSVFNQWLGSITITGEGRYTTNCREFTAEQIAFLRVHYGESHRFKYIPATYPKME